MLLARQGKIKVVNTLESRLDLIAGQVSWRTVAPPSIVLCVAGSYILLLVEPGHLWYKDIVKVYVFYEKGSYDKL